MRADIERARRGDPDAFARLVARFAAPLFRFARPLAGDDPGAEDIVQETFVRAHGALARYDPVRPFAAWLFKIAANLAVSRARAARRRRAAPLGETDPPARAGGGGAERAEADDAGVAVRRAVAELPPRYRALVVLYYLDEMDLADAAETLGIPVGTAKVRLFRARALLRARLGPALGETGRGDAA